MREPPRLADDTIIAALHTHYDLTVTALTFLPLGADMASAVYRVDAADGARYFLKLRAAMGFSPPSLLVPHFLHHQGVPHIVAPLPTTSQALWASLPDAALSLYPLLDARAAADEGLSEQQWRSLGTTLGQIHASQLPTKLLQFVAREAFVPSRRDLLARLEMVIARQSVTDLAQHELARFWRARQHEISAVLARSDALGRELRRDALSLALCHADLHTWNILADTARQIWIVDWDEVILAPKERDLMFVIGGIGRDLVRPHETTSFLQGYGDMAIDQRALVYYRYAWAVQDMGAYAEEVFFLPHLSEHARRDAVESLISLFEPGNIVDIAQASDRAV